MEVLEERLFLLASEGAVADVEVGLVVDEKSAVVKVAGAHDDVATVSNDEAVMHHFAVVLVELDFGVEVLSPEVLGGVTGDLGVDIGSG